MVSKIFFLAPLTFGLGLSGALAQTTAPAQPDINVTANKERSDKTARKFITQVLDTADGQLARFYDKVCLEVIGLPPAMRDKFADRFDTIARAVHAPMANRKCRPNLIVLFVADTDNFMKFMKARHRDVFYDLGDAEQMAALKPGAIRSWRQMEIRDDVGHGMLPDSRSENPMQFETPTHTRVVNAVVVMDRQTIIGKSLWQLADYSVMRTLAGARPPVKGSIGQDSIVSLFDPGVSPTPEGVTNMDLMLLAGLYSMGPAASGRDAYSQAVDISSRMTRPVKRK